MNAIKRTIQTQRTNLKGSTNSELTKWAESFLLDRKAQNLSEGSIKFYTRKLGGFVAYAHTHKVNSIKDITPDFLRQYFLDLEDTGHNEGGIHANYRTVKAFLRWYENEEEPTNWKNPIRKVKSPKVSEEPLEPVELVDVHKLVETCEKNTFVGERDFAIFLCLLDTGLRANELLRLNISDINLIEGSIVVRKGKGRKSRMAFLGSRSRKAVRAYLKCRHDKLDDLWIRDDFLGRLGYDGLRAIVTRHSKIAGIKPPSLHSFRRAFALQMLRNKVDLVTLSKLMGHSGLNVLRRYLKQVPEDLQIIHRTCSPVDNNL